MLFGLWVVLWLYEFSSLFAAARLLATPPINPKSSGQRVLVSPYVLSICMIIADVNEKSHERGSHAFSQPVRHVVERSRMDYNHCRPHCSPEYMMPVALAADYIWADHFNINAKMEMKC